MRLESIRGAAKILLNTKTLIESPEKGGKLFASTTPAPVQSQPEIKKKEFSPCKKGQANGLQHPPSAPYLQSYCTFMALFPTEGVP